MERTSMMLLLRKYFKFSLRWRPGWVNFLTEKNMVGVLFRNLKNLLKKWVTNNARQSLKAIKFRFSLSYSIKWLTLVKWSGLHKNYFLSVGWQIPLTRGVAGWFGHWDKHLAARDQTTGRYITGNHASMAIPTEMIRRLSVLYLFWDHICYSQRVVKPWSYNFSNMTFDI